MAGKRTRIFDGVVTKRETRNGTVVIEGSDYLHAALMGAASKLRIRVEQVLKEEVRKVIVAPPKKKSQRRKG